MIKAGIVGDHTVATGELIRLMLRHPDVALEWVSCPGLEGRRVDSLFRGLTGETDMTVVADHTASDVDVVICERWSDTVVEAAPPELRVIDLTRTKTEAEGYVYGLAEMGRRRLVDGCAHIVLPSPEAMVILLALLPLGKHLMLGGTIDVELRGAATVSAGLVAEVERAIRQVQQSFTGHVRITKADDPSDMLRADVRLDVNIDVALLGELFANTYERHNFTYIIGRQPEGDDVEGTNKCLVTLARDDDGRLHVSTVIDPLMKGRCTTAVHLLNLLFGLYERVGLDLYGCARSVITAPTPICQNEKTSNT